ncbi:hypothetical protein B0H14DRAFT_3753255 [Mycena olivaceomarginata]|nr:hypothetical protein B0H14DRAFT_3753255 [Mycena olivaceomarginata]
MARKPLKKFGVRMAVPFAQLFKRKDTDLMRPFRGKYPAISAEVGRSMVNLSSYAGDVLAGIDPNMINPANEMAGVEFDAIIAEEKEESSISSICSVSFRHNK